MSRRSLCTLLVLLVCASSAVRAQSLDDLGADVVRLDAPTTTMMGKRAHLVTTSRDVGQAYTGLLVRGVATDTTVAGAVRFREYGGWSEWHSLRFTFSATGPTFVAGYRSDRLRRGHDFELRFEITPEATFEIEAAGVFDNRTDADATEATPYDAPLPLVAPRRPHIRTPHLIRRSAWGADPFVRGQPVPLARPDYIYVTFHHAAGFSASNQQEGREQMRRIQDLHQNTRGWSDIGYQFVVDRAGNLYQGRPFMDEGEELADVPQLAMGAHVGGANTGNIGVCILGCYHPPEGTHCTHELTAAANDSLVAMFAWLLERYDLEPGDIRGHRDFSATACPGDNNYSRLDEIKAQVDDLLQTGNALLAHATLAAEVGTDGVVQLSWSFSEVNGLAAYRIERRSGAGEVVIYDATGTEGATFTDRGTSNVGPVTYRLFGVGADGREQLLAETSATVTHPGGFLLTDNFPEPFSNTTTLRYYLAQNAFNVRLVVYDVLGNEVAVLADDEEPATEQWHVATFDASGLGNGTYYARLTVEDFSGLAYDETRTLVRLR